MRISSGASLPDPFLLDESVNPAPPTVTYRDTKGLTLRSKSIDPTKKTLVFICAGQSLRMNINPTLYLPTNSAVVDNLNIYDGAIYNIAGPLLGTSTLTTSPFGPGNLCARVADLFVTNGRFDRVIIVPIAVGGTSLALWATGPLASRIPVAVRRLAAAGITPATPGVTFAIEMGIGEADYAIGTTQASFAASWATVVANAQAAGFAGRFFMPRETNANDTTSGTVLAQQAVVDNVTTFASGNINTIQLAQRLDAQHLNDAGAAAAATLIYNAMVASGAPF